MSMLNFYINRVEPVARRSGRARTGRDFRPGSADR
jgi:hypothetical protein